MTVAHHRLNTQADFPALRRQQLHTLQVNLGYRCNQACSHCHVDAGPHRSEMMSLATLDQVLEFMTENKVQVLDLTGGAPELNPHFRHAVRVARKSGVHVIDRCNLTILSEPGQADLAQFLAEQGVHIVASLPCYSAENVDSQRGKGVFARSIAGITQLNSIGYAELGTGLTLDFVFNPQGSSLPPDPAQLEAQYKRELAVHGIRFDRLLTITNVPINRFRHDLQRAGQLDGYMETLVDAYDASNLEHVMCRTLLSVDWQGYVYDCDFNQMLGMPAGGQRRHLSDLQSAALSGASIAVAAHCFACTAGRGSSCSGALQE
jgi:radical SAM/Cys-rich protein